VLQVGIAPEGPALHAPQSLGSRQLQVPQLPQTRKGPRGDDLKVILTNVQLLQASQSLKSCRGNRGQAIIRQIQEAKALQTLESLRRDVVEPSSAKIQAG